MSLSIRPSECVAEQDESAQLSSPHRSVPNGLYCILWHEDIYTKDTACERFSTEFTIYRHFTCGKSGQRGVRNKFRKEIPAYCSICVFSVNKKDYEKLYGPL